MRTLRQLGRAVRRRAVAPVSRRLTPLRDETFLGWDGQPLPYFIHNHNRTWTNERAVELRLAERFLQGVGGIGMEFGNVLSRYGLARPWTVVDKYEKARGVLNVDIVDYETAPLDFIVSVSSLEHVGWDEDVRDPEKVVRAYHHLLSLVKPDGRLFLTAAVGHSEFFDAALGGRLPADRQMTFVRDKAGRWAPSGDLRGRGVPAPIGVGCDSVWVAEARGQTL